MKLGLAAAFRRSAIGNSAIAIATIARKARIRGVTPFDGAFDGEVHGGSRVIGGMVPDCIAEQPSTARCEPTPVRTRGSWPNSAHRREGRAVAFAHDEVPAPCWHRRAGGARRGRLGSLGIVAIGMQLGAATPSNLGFDLELLLQAGRDIANGRSPYASELINGSAPTATHLFYSYPPPVAQAFAVFAFLPSNLALVTGASSPPVGSSPSARACAATTHPSGPPSRRWS